MPRNSPLVALMKIAIFISLALCLGYLIGGLNAMHVAKALTEENSTSLADISRRLENGFFYFRIAGVFAVVFLTGTYTVWRRTKVPLK